MPKGDGWRSPGTFIVFATPDGISGGIITDVVSLLVRDWIHVVSKTGVVWAPVWSDSDNMNPVRWLKCTDGYQPHVVAVNESKVISSCELHARKFTATIISRLENLGYDQFTLL